MSRGPRRARELLQLIAEGLSNSAITARLFVTERTAEAHSTQILQLGIHADPTSNRRVVAALAFLRTRSWS